MKLDQLPASYRGKGVKIGIIDSGAAATHRDLKGRIHTGYNVLAKSEQGWDDDTVGHGTHCAGIIAGDTDNAEGIRGFAPDAEVIVCKVFPGGTYSSLIDALDFCIAQQVDIINLSLGGGTEAPPSELIEQKILEARQLGIACIVAAGNSSGPVQYPASSPNVLAVSAIGKQGEFPADSYHAQTVTAPVTPQGFFSPNFTCYGPQIGVCAPGVAIVSSVPENNFAAWDGTSIAAPHVTGLAALILAHHPDFQFSARNWHRVDRLFQIIRQTAQPLNLGDPLRTGAGLPDAARACLTQPVGRRAGDFAQQISRGGFAPQVAAAFQAPLGGSVGAGQAASGRPMPYPVGTQQSTLNPQQVSNLLDAIQQLGNMMQAGGLR